MFCVSFIQMFSIGKVLEMKFSIVLFRWTPASFLSKNSVLVLDGTQWWYLIRGISSVPLNVASINYSSPL